MFFKFIRVIARTILAVVNGNAHYQNQDKLPNLVGPCLYGSGRIA